VRSFWHLNRNKRSIVLDLKHPSGLAAVLKLVARADVLVWNVRPAAMARLKLSYDDVRAVNPQIIYCGMFGFGQAGRYRDKPAYDSIIQGAGGMAAIHHRAAGEPRYVPMVVADKTVGMVAVQMILMALYPPRHYRRRLLDRDPDVREPGQVRARRAHVSENLRASARRDGRPAAARSARQADSGRATAGSASRRIRTRRRLRFSTRWAVRSSRPMPRFFQRAGALRQRGRLFSDPRRHAENQDHGRVARVFDRNDVPAMPYHTLDSLLDDPHLSDVGFFALKDHPTKAHPRVAIAQPVVVRNPTGWSPAPKLVRASG
jgi:crotonobetainyl-CoA:carnitine CoA-transferase CaiB-like acyl-CoA transferase